MVKELGFDACLDHHAPDLAEQLKEACPKGIDVYFENVGGHVWDAVFPLLNDFARIPVCGLIAQYNATPPFPGPDRLPVVMREVLSRSLHIRGFIQREFADQRPAFYKEMGQWIREGRVKYREDVIEGLDRAPGGTDRAAAGEEFRQAGRQGAIASRPGFGGRRCRENSRLVLIACYLAIFAIGENSTAIMAALPAMSRGLGLGPAVVEWTVNAYLLAAAAFIILGGRAADGFGPRRSSAAGIALFALASLIIALAPNGPAARRRPHAAGAGCGLRRRRHIGGRDAGRSRSGTPKCNRHLDRISDAGLQHWSTPGRGGHPLRRAGASISG